MLQWLLDGDPAIRWQVLRDLTDASPDEVAAERARVEHEGWGARLLARQGPDGLWDGGACFPARLRAATSPASRGRPTMHTLQTAADPRARPGVGAARTAVALVAEHGALGARRAARTSTARSSRASTAARSRPAPTSGWTSAPIVERILGEQLADGGWNCEAENGSVRSSFDTTINVLDGLLEYERATGGSAEVAEARRRGEEYLLERGLFRRRSTGEVVGSGVSRRSPSRTTGTTTCCGRSTTSAARARSPIPGWRRPSRWCARSASPDGRWLLDRIHPGRVHFDLEAGVGRPSRWNTLRALRVLDWWDRRS